MRTWLSISVHRPPDDGVSLSLFSGHYRTAKMPSKCHRSSPDEPVDRTFVVDLPVRVFNVLRANGIDCLRDLKGVTAIEMQMAELRSEIYA